MKTLPPRIKMIILQIGRIVFLGMIAAYRAAISPVLAAAIGPACRFQPTCSEYAYEAVRRHGIVRGGWMAIGRLARCRPGGGWGYDPAPPADSRSHA
jgi:putative membrane protein insertion efficiency factor